MSAMPSPSMSANQASEAVSMSVVSRSQVGTMSGLPPSHPRGSYVPSPNSRTDRGGILFAVCELVVDVLDVNHVDPQALALAELGQRGHRRRELAGGHDHEI